MALILRILCINISVLFAEFTYQTTRMNEVR